MGTEYFLQNLETEDIHIYLHEIGHTFALDGTSSSEVTSGNNSIED